MNGVLVAYVGLSSLIATLGMSYFWAGLANIISNGTGTPLDALQGSWLTTILVGQIGSFPVQIVWGVGIRDSRGRPVQSAQARRLCALCRGQHRRGARDGRQHRTHQAVDLRVRRTDRRHRRGDDLADQRQLLPQRGQWTALACSGCPCSSAGRRCWEASAALPAHSSAR